MNVLFLDQFGQLGGAQHCLLDLIPAVLSRGWVAHAAVPFEELARTTELGAAATGRVSPRSVGRAGPVRAFEGDLASRLRILGVNVTEISPGHYSSGRKTPGDAIRFAARIPALVRQLSALISLHRIDLLYVNGPRMLPVAALAGKGLPVLFHAHSYLGPGLGRVVAGLALRRSDATVAAVSSFAADSLRRWVPAGRMFVVPNGTADLLRPHDGSFPRVGIVGRIAPEKGHLEFIEAARLLTGWMPECRFAVCGGPFFSRSDYAAEVHKRAKDLPIEFMGWREDIGTVLAGLDVLAAPSTGDEAFGRVIVEAFSAQVPVVAFRTGGIPELVEDGVTGFLAREKTAQALAERIRAVLSNREARQATVRKARALWQSNYTIEQYRDRITALMARAAASRTAKRPAAP
jgi:glycosyltransferase involved in cell wall biosynthesis